MHTKQLKTFVREIRDLKTRAREPDKLLLVLLLFLGVKYLEKKEIIESNPDSKRIATEFNDIIARARLLSPENPFLTEIAPEQLEKQLESFNSLNRLLENSPELKNRLSILGDTYQTWQTDQRSLALQNIQKANKNISVDELISFTQIYTPDWVVEFLLANTIDAELNPWCLPEKSTTPKNPESIKILDPACGSGNFLVGAYQFLKSYYASQGIPAGAAFNQIIDNQLFGADIDERALSVVSLIFAILSKEAGIMPTVPFKNLVHLKIGQVGELGSLNKKLPDGHILNNRYDIVVTNPPYIGRKLLGRSLKASLKTNYPRSYSDMSAAFVERGLDLLNHGGKFGVITQASLIALPTYRKLRTSILKDYNINLVVDLGPGVFPTQNGEKINSALIVFENNTSNDADSQIRLIDLKATKDKEKSLKQDLDQLRNQKPAINAKFNILSKVSIESLYNRSFNCMIPREILNFMKAGQKLSQIADVKQGLATTDNKKFVKYLWEIDPSQLNKIWFPYAKGSGNSRWYSPVIHVVDWEDNGRRIKDTVQEKYPYLKGKVNWVVKNESYYFKSGISFSFVNSKGLAFRLLPSNCIFDVGASSVFPEELDKHFLLGYLNSSFVNAFVGSINPTINNQVGDIKQIPVILPDLDTQIRIKTISSKCFQLSKKLFELTNPISIYTNVFYQSISPDIGNLFLKEPYPKDLTINEMFNRYIAEIASLKNQIESLEEELDGTVKESVSKNLNISKEEELKLFEWIDSFERSPINTEVFSKRRSFISRYLINKKLCEQFNLVNRENPVEEIFSHIQISQFLDRDLDKYIKSDLKTFIDRLFCGRVPECLLLDDIEKLLNV